MLNAIVMIRGRIFLGVILIVAVLFSSCQTKAPSKVKDTPTMGNIKIAVDESYQLLAEAELYTFQALYPNAQITPIYASEDSVRSLFLSDTDSIRIMITSRKLTENEEAYLKSKLIIPRTSKIAHDALALIVNKSNPQVFLRYNTVKDIFTGKTTNWKQVNPKSNLDNIKVIFDNVGSGNVRTIMDKFKITGSLPNYCYSVEKNAEVVSYVEKHPEAIGIISVNWVSDPQDSISHSFLKKINVVSVSSEFNPDGDEYYSPHPAYIAQQSYPFVRELYIINRETYSGLGSGFTSFVASDPGQRIILRMGMLPASAPVRVVEIKRE